MRMYDIIKNKRDGGELSAAHINYLVKHYARGKIPDYQMAALLMAIYFNKMTSRETFDLTNAMINSGDVVNLSEIDGIKVDKHSTGGVGDTVTLILGPMVAASNVPFVKMSGRGLGHTGGTLDKLESIDGFKVELSVEEFLRNINDIYISIVSQTSNIAPADKKLYSLRDVTATVDNLSLIASSIMSKKLAIGSDAIVLDVKVGSGAFVKNLEDALELSKEMVRIGTNYGRKTVALITNMNEPLGKAIGNSLEIKEAIEVLQGYGPNDLRELSLELGSLILLLAKKVKHKNEGRAILEEILDSGQAFNKFIELVKYQGGSIEQIINPDLLPKAKYIIEVKNNINGFVTSINAEKIGECALELGAGRETMNSKVDLSVGIILNKKVNDKVCIGDTIAFIHTNDLNKGEEVKKKIQDIFIVESKPKEDKKLILGLVTENEIKIY